MNKVSGKLLLLLVLSLVFTGCADITVRQLRKEKISLTSEKKNVGGLIGADKPEEMPVERELKVVEAEEENGLDTVSMADTDISEATQADEVKEANVLSPASVADVDIIEAPPAYKAKEEVVKTKPIILASTGTFLSKRKKQSLKDVYGDAYNLYKRRNFKGAISAFSSFIINYPSTSYTDNAFYWRGECYYAMGKYRQAIDEFDLVEKKFPKGNKVPDAMLKKGYSYLKIKNIPKAKSFFKKVMKLYPSSSAAKKAAKKIN